MARIGQPVDVRLWRDGAADDLDVAVALQDIDDRLDDGERDPQLRGQLGARVGARDVHRPRETW